MTGYPWDSITNRLLKADDLNAAFATAYTNANQAITTANTAMAYVNTAVQYTLPVATPARWPDALTWRRWRDVGGLRHHRRLSRGRQ
jgi:hypothetical protein